MSAGFGVPVLSDGDVAGFERWLVAGEAYGTASQGLVGTSTELATTSRDLADHLERDGAELRVAAGGDRTLALALRELAAAVEAQSLELRDGHALTATTLKDLRSIGADGDA